MSTPKNIKGKLGNDDVWAARMAEFNSRTIKRLAEKGKKMPEQIQTQNAAADPLACGEDCPICHGQGFTVDHTDSAHPCPRYEERRRAARKGNGDD